MKDLHSHLLPTIDDGARSSESTLRMLKSAHDNGVTDIMFTPHYIEESEFCSTYANNLNIFKDIETIAKEMDIKVYLGNEVYCTPNILSLYNEGFITTLNQSRYMLIEIPMYSKMNNIKDIFFELISNGITPILAHPERYTAYYKDLDFFSSLQEMGVLMQLNYPSLLGMYGKKAKEMAKLLLQHNLISFIGSDIHSSSEGKYEVLSKLEKKLKKLVGNENYLKYTETNFTKVINNEEI